MNVWDAMMKAARPRGAGQTHATVAGALGWLATMPHGAALRGGRGVTDPLRLAALLTWARGVLR